ncbi:condensation domain-containing protein, partial [Mesorhizobium mediterraneum]|uniref:condensation domain-containing protein n=1 Tax=Mesorhizobium mediterraneum TaxID=43617 RepID=UPI00177F5C57
EGSIDGRALGVLADRLGVPLSAVLLAGLGVQLWRRSGQARLSVDHLFSCRSYPELQGVLGPFARFLPVPVAIREGSAFDDLARSVSASLKEAQKWQEYYSGEG